MYSGTIVIFRNNTSLKVEMAAAPRTLVPLVLVGALFSTSCAFVLTPPQTSSSLTTRLFSTQVTAPQKPWWAPAKVGDLGFKITLGLVEGTSKDEVRNALPADEKWTIDDAGLTSPLLKGREGRKRLGTVVSSLSDVVNGSIVSFETKELSFLGLRKFCQQWVKYEPGLALILGGTSVVPDGSRKKVNAKIGKTETVDDLISFLNPDQDEMTYRLDLRTPNTLKIYGGPSTDVLKWLNFLTTAIIAAVQKKQPSPFLVETNPDYIFDRIFDWWIPKSTAGTTMKYHLNNLRLEKNYDDVSSSSSSEEVVAPEEES